MPWGWRLLCLWPGLARLWLRGDLYALGLAVFYSILLNLALVSSLIWPAYLGSRFLLVAWPMLAVVWLASAWLSWRGLPIWLQVGQKIVAPAELPVDTLFNQAQREYLKGNWVQARELLERRLRLRPRDVESRLLLLSVLRRVGRFQAALQELQLLEGMDEARPWSSELARERERLQRHEQSLQQEETSAQELRDEKELSSDLVPEQDAVPDAASQDRSPRVLFVEQTAESGESTGEVGGTDEGSSGSQQRRVA